MIPLFFEEADTALITQIEADLAATVKRNGRNLPIRNPITFMSSPSIVLNDPTDARDNTYEVDSVSISPVWDFISEPNAERDGSMAGQPREVQKMISINGFVRATSLAQLHDNIAALNRAFNPVLNYISDSESSEFDVGFLPLKFYMPTDDTGNWSDGFIKQQYYVRPVAMPVDTATKFDDFSARFNIQLMAIDPRKYEQTTQTASRTGTGNVTIDNSKATYDSWPIVKITFIGAPVGDFDYNYNNVAGLGTEDEKTVFLEAADLSDAAGETLVIDHQKRIVYYEDDGENKIAAVKSGTKFFRIIGGVSAAINISANIPSGAVVEVIWRRAFV